MFRRLADVGAAEVRIKIDGRAFMARGGDTVAAALLAAGVGPYRTSVVSGQARSPYCMMGVCFECLVTIDGAGNRQGCLIEVREGMQIETQKGKREARP